ncbi:MAG: guanylate kinase [Lachnospiraceae bacterium]|nr:guanylate kinase [Lachnospiraceae bacterium]
MADRGILIIVSGFSGAGKGTVMKRIMNDYNNYALSISATTRNPRAGEENGREYFFKTVEEFENMIANDQLIEYAQYVGNYYGTPKEYVESMLNQGKDVILEIEMQGAMKVKEKMPDTLLVFVTPPSAQELKNRLVGRGTEDMDTINARLKRANEEVYYMDKYDYLLINDDLDQCVKELHEIIQSEHSRVSRNINKINFFREDLKIFSEGE